MAKAKVVKAKKETVSKPALSAESKKKKETSTDVIYVVSTHQHYDDYKRAESESAVKAAYRNIKDAYLCAIKLLVKKNEGNSYLKSAKLVKLLEGETDEKEKEAETAQDTAKGADDDSDPGLDYQSDDDAGVRIFIRYF